VHSAGTGITSHVFNVDKAQINTIVPSTAAAKMLAYIQLLARSDAAIETDNSTELGEINADGGSGAGNFSAQTDSVEALQAAAASKTGYKLASNGLDSITTTGPAGVASNFREMVVQTWRRFFGKATMTSTALVTYDDAGTTAATTQTLSDDSTTQTQGKASSV